MHGWSAEALNLWRTKVTDEALNAKIEQVCSIRPVYIILFQSITFFSAYVAIGSSPLRICKAISRLANVAQTSLQQDDIISFELPKTNNGRYTAKVHAQMNYFTFKFYATGYLSVNACFLMF